MSLDQILRVVNMDRYSRKSIRISLRLANSVMAVAGIATLLYSAWMTVVCLRHYQKHHLSWFLWACVGVGAIFCFTAFIGHIAAKTRRNTCLLSSYILALFLLLLAEILVAADVFLNDDWDKDFPKDPTDRFDDFVKFADDNDQVFTFFTFLMMFTQVISFILAMILITMHHNYRSLPEQCEHHHEDQVPVHIPIGSPYFLGHPQYPPQTNMLGQTLVDKDSYVQHPEKGVWPTGGAGYPPLHP